MLRDAPGGAMLEASLLCLTRSIVTVVPMLSFFNAVVSPPFGDVGLRASIPVLFLLNRHSLQNDCVRVVEIDVTGVEIW